MASDLPNVECFFDCSSPWTYMGFERLLKLQEHIAFTIEWKPILVGGVFNEVNKGLYAARESMFANERRMTYFMKDMMDWADYCEIKIGWPDFHPVNSVKAMRGCFVALEQDCLVNYARACFQAYWTRQENISDHAVLTTICTEVGIDSDVFFTKINEQNYKDQLRTTTDELIARNGYGSPTFFVNTTDMYFGNDRIPLLEKRLSKG